MLNTVILQENQFALHFLTAQDGERNWHADVQNAMGENGVVLQETIIAPSSHIEHVGKYFQQSEHHKSAGQPLILIGNDRLPVQYSSIIAKPLNGEAQIDVMPNGAQLSTDGIKILFGYPIYSSPDSSETSFLRTFEKMSKILAEGDMQESDLVRTWLFLKDVLYEYPLLNIARDQYFQGWYSNRNAFIPASTGIQGIVKQYAPLTIAFCAFSGKHIEIRQIASSMQNEPIKYNKLFSRAVQVSFPQNRLLFISGTASINQKGETVHIHNLTDQIHQTLEVIKEILKEQNAYFSDIAQAIVYLKSDEDLDQCMKILDTSGFPCNRSLFQIDTDICRPELLCEIEAIAVIRRDT